MVWRLHVDVDGCLIFSPVTLELLIPRAPASFTKEQKAKTEARREAKKKRANKAKESV